MRFVMQLWQRHLSNIPCTLRTWEIHKFCRAKEISKELRLTTTRRPPYVASSEQVIVQTEAASLNPIDALIMSGYGSAAFRWARAFKNGFFPSALSQSDFPLIPGRDFSGCVSVAGPDAVKAGFVEGQSVLGAVWPFNRGCLTDYVVCPRHFLAVRPESLNPVAAASLSYAGLTAWSALRNGGGFCPKKVEPGFGPRVLVTGVTGAVGSIASQLAIMGGASHLTVTCPSRADPKEIKRLLSAHQVISAPNTPPASESYDLIIDCVRPTYLKASEGASGLCHRVAGEEQFPLLRYLSSHSRARYVSVNPPLFRYMAELGPLLGIGASALSLLMPNLRNISRANCGQIRWAFFEPSGSRLQLMANWAAEGRLHVPIDSIFPFSEVPVAFKKMQAGGNNGKIAISWSPSAS
ncbi:unnamed protein product [Schistocephalus solidus]|uniref:Reticulon-4-interacting protein 1 n=1 Tax=Schistocephalus solidus TaxID=70667 RepID=A0A0X3PST0_SCHSO|nr:unnamed protein product [Schistocephalus solidus]